jgi:superfamily II DNA or RNA helicase
MNRELWPHQASALTALRQTIGQGVKRVVLCSPTGSGKTLLSAAIAESALSKGKKLAFVVSHLGLVDQAVEAFYAEGMREIGVVQGSHYLTDWGKPITVCTIQTLAAREALPQADVVIMDECLVAGTKIATPSGERNIEDLRVGDCVFNAIGVGRIEAVSKRSKTILKIGLSNGRELGISRFHPLFTEKGWRHAEAVERGSRLFSQQAMSNLWGEFSPGPFATRNEMGRKNFLFTEVRHNQAELVEAFGDTSRQERVRLLQKDIYPMDQGRKHAGRKGLERARMLLSILCQEIQKPDARTGNPGKASGHAAENSAQADCAGWEWTRDDAASIKDFANFRGGLDTGVCHSNEDVENLWISDLLQAGYSEPRIKDWNRGRWWQPRIPACQEYRPEEGGFFGDIRVESVSNEECRGHQDVYNIQVSGHPSYFANGALVHNCHVLHRFHKKWLSDPAWAGVPFIGLSATPGTRGLGRYFETLINVSTTQDLINQGLLSPFRVFGAGHPDLSKVKIVAGDYHEGQLGETMQGGSLTADIVRNWQTNWGKDKTICYGVNRAHAKSIQERFLAAGIAAGYQDGWTSPEDRRDIKRKFHNGEYRVVCNVGTLTVGTDWNCHCLILARPTRSKMLHQQIIGRALRTAPDKPFATVFDHADNTARLGFVTDIHWEQLDSGTPDEKNKVERKTPLPKECSKCSCMLPKQAGVCQNCGFEAKMVCSIAENDDELVELIPGRTAAKAKKRVYTMDEKERFYASLRAYQQQKGYRDGWSANQYRQKFGVWPNSLRSTAPAKLISPDVMLWIRSRQIAFAKSREKAARVAV